MTWMTRSDLPRVGNCYACLWTHGVYNRGSHIHDSKFWCDQHYSL